MTVGRRDFITLMGGAAAGWPIVAQAQRAGQMRRIGALISRPSKRRSDRAGEHCGQLPP